jgi:antitoxin (DNA-binding transcriptional repressor) of toxin-antitoxin stability system
MEDVSIAHAREHLDELIARAQDGEVIVISDPKLGNERILPQPRQPDLLAPRVTDTMPPFVPLKENRRFGHQEGKMVVPARLMEPMTEEELRDWYGDE